MEHSQHNDASVLYEPIMKIAEGANKNSWNSDLLEMSY